MAAGAFRGMLLALLLARPGAAQAQAQAQIVTWTLSDEIAHFPGTFGQVEWIGDSLDAEA